MDSVFSGYNYYPNNLYHEQKLSLFRVTYNSTSCECVCACVLACVRACVFTGG